MTVPGSAGSPHGPAEPGARSVRRPYSTHIMYRHTAMPPPPTR